MNRVLISAFLTVLLPVSGCGSDPGPEDFALHVATAVAENDWPAYRDLALARARVLATEANPTATRGTFAGLAGAEEGQIQRDFDRTVRSGVIERGALSSYRAVVKATEPDRWVVHVLEADGRPTGLEMTLVRSGESYRVATLDAR